MWKWLKGHPRLYAIGGVLVVIGGGLATIEGVWSLFSPDPLFPFIYNKVSQFLPTWPRYLLIGFWLLVVVFGIVLLVQVIRQTKLKIKPKSQVPDNRGGAMRSNYYSGFVNVGKVRAGANLKIVAKVGDYTSDTVTTNSAGYYNSLEVKPPNASYKGLHVEFYVEGKKVSRTEDYMGGGHSPNFFNLDVEE